jgi:uncharacterized protein (TIGR03083 family)
MGLRATRSTVEEMVAAEHAEFCSFVGGLSAAQWQAETLCEGWSVRDVVAHVADHVHRTGGDALRAIVRGRLSPTRSAELIVEGQRDRRVTDLLASLEPPVRSPSSVQLAELVIHQQDIRRPLGIEREMAGDRLLACLDFALTRKGSMAVSGARRLATGLRLSATDLGWSWGDGPEARGAAEAVLMAVNGRIGATRELDGEGATVLVERTRRTR